VTLSLEENDLLFENELKSFQKCQALKKELHLRKITLFVSCLLKPPLQLFCLTLGCGSGIFQPQQVSLTAISSDCKSVSYFSTWRAEFISVKFEELGDKT
jgi:hypothetical protein